MRSPIRLIDWPSQSRRKSRWRSTPLTSYEDSAKPRVARSHSSPESLAERPLRSYIGPYVWPDAPAKGTVRLPRSLLEVRPTGLALGLTFWLLFNIAVVLGLTLLARRWRAQRRGAEAPQEPVDVHGYSALILARLC